jgi:hypothetical protein
MAKQLVITRCVDCPYLRLDDHKSCLNLNDFFLPDDLDVLRQIPDCCPLPDVVEK